VTEFKSRFVESPDEEDALQFKVDTSLSYRYNDLASGLTSILIDMYPRFVKEGLREPAEVLRQTREYQARVDVYLEFVNDNITATGIRTDTLRLADIFSCYRQYMRLFGGDGRVAPAKDLKQYLDVHMGRSEHNCWKGYRLTPPSEEDDE
jgi:phage/plasmid-associated DNA primase